MEYGYKKHEKHEEQLPRPHKQVPGGRLRAKSLQMLEAHQLGDAHALPVDAQDFVAPQRPTGNAAGQQTEDYAEERKAKWRH